MKRLGKITEVFSIILLCVFTLLIIYKFLEIKKILTVESIKETSLYSLEILGAYFIILVIITTFLFFKIYYNSSKKKQEVLQLKNKLTIKKVEVKEEVTKKTLKENRIESIDELRTLFVKTKKIKSKEVLNKVIEIFDGVKGLYYQLSDDNKTLKIKAEFATETSKEGSEITLEDNIIGEVIHSKKIKYLTNIPKDYINILSGLGDSKPVSIIIIPFIQADSIIGVAEIALFNEVNNEIKEVAESIQKIEL